MSLNVAHGNCKVCNFLSTAQKLPHCSVIQLKLFFSPIQMRVLPSALPPDQRCGGLLSMYYSLWVVCHKETARPHQTKYYTVPSLPSGPETFPTANKRNTFGLTQIMFLRPRHKNYWWWNVLPVVYMVPFCHQPKKNSCYCCHNCELIFQENINYDL